MWNERTLRMPGSDSITRKLGSIWIEPETPWMGFLHSIVPGGKNGFTTITPRGENQTTWLCFRIDSQGEYSWKITHVVYLVGSA